VDYWLPNQPAFRRLHEEISQNHVGVSRDGCQEALDLARKYEWPSSVNPAAKASASLPITPASGVQLQNSERGYIEKLEEWEGRSAERLEHGHRRNPPDRSGSLDREGFANADGSDAMEIDQTHLTEEEQPHRPATAAASGGGARKRQRPC
jgi:hypothetical protein